MNVKVAKVSSQQQKTSRANGAKEQERRASGVIEEWVVLINEQLFIYRNTAKLACHPQRLFLFRQLICNHLSSAQVFSERGDRLGFSGEIGPSIRLIITE